MLRRLENLTCLLAALAALLVEASLIYCIRPYPATNPTRSWAYTASWTSPALSPCRLGTVVIAMFYYLWRLAEADAQKATESRRTFPRIWYWFLALASTHGLDRDLNHARLVHR